MCFTLSRKSAFGARTEWFSVLMFDSSKMSKYSGHQFVNGDFVNERNRALKLKRSFNMISDFFLQFRLFLE